MKLTHGRRGRIGAVFTLFALSGAVGATQATAAGVPPTPHTLPGSAAAAHVDADPHTWIVGAREGRASAQVAARFGAKPITAGSWEVARAKARAFADALDERGLLLYSEPNRVASPLQAPAADPLSHRTPWRNIVVGGATPPPVTAASPLLALIDSPADLSHPEWAGGRLTRADQTPVTDSHGTATAAVAAAPANGVGILGVWPGMKTVNISLPTSNRCSDLARAMRDAVNRGAKVLNMSYGSDQPCHAEYVEMQHATRAGVILVAAAGNELQQGNPLEYPASLPHVITVAAIGSDGEPSYFSNANAAIDLSAPGENVLAPTPAKFDSSDGTRDGYEFMDGTSFSAPMVAAAAAWVTQARPELTPDQVAQVVRLSARDISTKGWDKHTGFGVLSIPSALERKPPPVDAQEPDDDIIWVDGRAFGRANKPLWSGGKPVRRLGLIDRYEDPRDVFRVTVPRRSKVSITMRARGGDPDLVATSARSKTMRRAKLVASSRRRGRATDRIRLVNKGSRSKRFYVVAYVDRSASSLDAVYDLRIRKTTR